MCVYEVVCVSEYKVTIYENDSLVKWTKSNTSLRATIDDSLNDNKHKSATGSLILFEITKYLRNKM